MFPIAARRPRRSWSCVARGGGAPSLAHPGYRGAGPSAPKDDLIPDLIDAGLVAVEAIHSSHDAQQQAHYIKLAETHGLAITGGSDYHGEGTRRAEFFGVVHLPSAYFDAFVERAKSAQARGTH